jgi:Tol biopolymer transport system component
MGRVYLAEQREPLQREVALKVLKTTGEGGETAARFLAECQSLALLNHPNIARVLDAGTSARGEPYLVMELIDGAPITEYCDSRQLKISQRVELFIPVCLALHHAHQRKLLHRDVKPSNILVAEDDGRPRPKVIDFGIAVMLFPQSAVPARQRGPGRVLGTPEYMSPEQLLSGSGSADAVATDIYSLGVVLYELLTSTLPVDWDAVRDRSPAERAAWLRTAAVLQGPRLVRSPQVSGEAARNRRVEPARLRRQLTGELEWILLKALDPEPQRRYVSAAAFAADLQSYLDREPVAAGPPSLFYRARKGMARRKGALAVAMLVAFLLVATGRLEWQRRSVDQLQQRAARIRVLPFANLPGHEWSPSPAPDGSRVAFAWDGPDANHFEIYTVDRPNGAPRRLTDSVLPSYSPAWSPDGRWIAYLQWMGERAQVRLLDPARGSSRAVAPAKSNSTRTSALAWLPDSRHLLFPYDNGIGVVDITTGAIWPLTAGSARGPDFQPSVGPDGHTLTFVRDFSATSSVPCLLRLESDGHSTGQPQCLRLRGFEHATVDYPLLLPDGSLLLVSSRGARNRFWRVPDRGQGEATPLGELGDEVMMPALSYRQRRLLFARNVVDLDIWRLDIPPSDGAAVHTAPLLTSHRREESPQYSPDGRRIVFVSNRSGYHELWLADADGGRATQLTHFESASVLGSPRWSPDGREIVFDARVDGQPEIYSVRVAGGPPRRLTYDPALDVTPCFSSDGRWIYFASDRSGQRRVYRMPAAGGPALPVIPGPSFAPVASPDGRWLYYARARADITELLRRPVDGGPEELVAERMPDRAFAVSARGVYVLTVEPGVRPSRLIFIDDRSGRRRTLATFTQRLLRGFSISPDERSLLYTVFAQDGSDLLRVEKFLP